MEKASRVAVTAHRPLAAGGITVTHHHAAIIIKGGRTLGVGVNRMTNHPDHVPDVKRQASIHAEVAAVRACGNSDLRGATIYVARVNRRGEQAMSKPCQNCQDFLVERGIKKIFYTIESSIEFD